MESRKGMKRDRSNAELELKYKQNKRILNEGLQALSLSHYTAITDEFNEEVDELHNLTHDSVAGLPGSNVKVRSDSECTTDSTESDVQQPVEEEHLISVLKGGQIKYLRKVDFLVDDLIRKTHRTEVSRSYCPKDFDSRIPSSTGPSPTLDHALSNPLWPVKIYDSTHFIDSASLGIYPHRVTGVRESSDGYLHDEEEIGRESDSEYDSDSDDDLEGKIRGYTVRHPRESCQSRLAQGIRAKMPCTLAGDSSHSDWGIQDVRSPSLKKRLHSGEDDSVVSYISDRVEVLDDNTCHEEQQQAALSKRGQWQDHSDSAMDDSCGSTCSSNVSNVSSVSTLSNLSASPRVPYFIVADENHSQQQQCATSPPAHLNDRPGLVSGCGRGNGSTLLYNKGSIDFSEVGDGGRDSAQFADVVVDDEVCMDEWGSALSDSPVSTAPDCYRDGNMSGLYHMGGAAAGGGVPVVAGWSTSVR